jgi:uncharacterized protein (TIGR02246 family)
MNMSRLIRSLLLGLLACIAVTAGAARANDTSAKAASESKAAADRLAILGLLTKVESDFNAGDAKALASCWTEDGEFVGPTGTRSEGREMIEKDFQEAFAARKESCKLQFHLRHFRLAGEALALVEAVAEVKPVHVIGGMPIADFVFVKQSDRWLIESIRETIAHLPPDPTHLKVIDWLVGEWSSEASDTGISLQFSCDWTANRAFLIRKFKLEGKQALIQGGTEVIGWDPRANRIRSWVFDSDGGFGENVWVRDGNRWLIKYSGTLADGREVTSTHILTEVDAGTLSLQSKDRVVNGAALPDVPETTLKRQEAKPAAKAAEPIKPAGKAAEPIKPVEKTAEPVKPAEKSGK